ncbi:MAG: type II secretion system F family protein [Desulfuromonadaceae bacterium]|nr:type II secretion system F family protein [Desulfuromonadaceae bacterium]MDD2848801.1 type II secretion system F family protein [Desulfuromonadaceae bacterium]MDD4130451.1 type II secretion system F family protein [Desulfuromonadaceae bacterium]
MNNYAYQAVDTSGRQVQGNIEADSVETATSDLSGRGLYVLEIDSKISPLTDVKKWFRQGKIKRIDLIDLANNLSVMVGAGIPLLTSLGDIATATSNPALQAIIHDIRQNIERGSGFAEVLERHKGIFPNVFIRLVRVGEETGRFEKSLADAAEHLQRMEDLSSTIKRALIYPIFAIVTTLGALAFWMIYVLPKIIETLIGMGVKLPLLTRVLIVSSHLSQRFWYLGLLLPVLLFVIIKLMKRTDRGRYLVDLLKLKFPIYKLIEYNQLLALFAEQMRILIVSGLTVDRTLGIISDLMGNEIFRRAIAAVRDEITYGSTIAEAMRRQPIFPPLLIRMVSIGEASGTLDNQFSFLATHYLKKLDDISEKLGKIIEPLVVTAVGMLFAVIIAGLLLPIYDLVAKVGKG